MDIRQALIIGGGIGGFCAAIALRRVGIDAQVLEQADSLREVGAGLAVWTNASKVLKSLGVLDPVFPSASITERFQIRTWNGDVLDESQPGELGLRLGSPNLVVRRADVLRALASKVGREAVAVGTRVVGHEQDSGCVIVGLSDGSERRGAVLIGADGLHSVVREQLFGDGPPR
jgi:2-polyprenyl-6-methoxyphenol hydroxylase-like FAD-dependent oxidoreductase